MSFTTASTSPVIAPAGSAFGGIRRFIATVAAWNEGRVTRKMLHRLSNRELDDIGLTRADIDLL